MGRKCVVPNCRSGLQSNKKEVEKLAARDAPYNFGRKISISKFPKDEYMQEKVIIGLHPTTVCVSYIFRRKISLIQTVICMEIAVNVLRLDQRPYHEPFRAALNI